MNKKYRKTKKRVARLVNNFYRVRYKGLANEPNDVPYIACCNHTSALDVAIFSVGLSRQIHYLSKKEVFKVPFLRGFAKNMGAIPIDRGHGDVIAVKKCIEMLKSGECMGIFPQGTRQRKKDPRQTPIKDGVGMMADRAKVGILPVCIRTNKNKLKMFHKTDFIVGEFISYEKLEEMFGHLTGKEKHRKITEYAFSKVCELNELPRLTKETAEKWCLNRFENPPMLEEKK